MHSAQLSSARGIVEPRYTVLCIWQDYYHGIPRPPKLFEAGNCRVKQVLLIIQISLFVPFVQFVGSVIISFRMQCKWSVRKPLAVGRAVRTRRTINPANAAATETPVASADTVNTCINAIRFLSIDAVNKANSGHPGAPMGCAPMTYVLWNEVMKYNPKNPSFYNRDRFVLSIGHASMLLYSMLHLTGFDSVTVRKALETATILAVSVCMSNLCNNL
jgi:hypothetical protein